MEGTWRHVKCSSTWTSPSPPAAKPLQVPPTVTVNQKDMNSRQFLLPFIPERTTVENRFAVQEPLVPRTLNTDFAKSANAEMGHSILSLLSANPHHLHSEFSQLTNICAHGNDIGSASSGVQLRSIPSSSQSSHSASGSMWKAKIRSFDESRSSLVYDSPNATEINSTLQISACKPVPSAFQDISVGKASMSCCWPANARPGNTDKHQPLIIKMNNTSQTMPTEAGSTVPSDSARSRGRPRVICMKTVGELFLSELGLLGVICFCHNMHMSVAKFCEHSGYSANPGDAAHLENGMTVAQWRKLYFGSNASDDDKGWEWPDGPLVKNSFIKSWGSSYPNGPSVKDSFIRFSGNSYPTLSQNPNSADSIETVGGFANSGDPRNKSSYAMPPCTGVQQASIKYPINKVADYVHHDNRLEREGFISPSKGHAPVLFKSLTLHTVEKNTNCLNSVALHSTLNKRERNAWSRFVSNSDNCEGKSGTQSLCDRHTDVKSLTHKSSSSRNSFASEALMVTRDGNSSNIDLHLGQPSQAHNSLSSLSTATNLMDFGAMCNPQTFQENSPLTENTDHSRETKKLRIGHWCPSSKSSMTYRGPSQHTVGSSSTSSHSEPKELVGNATKSSLVSLFLSHLNTEGSGASQLSTVINNSKPCVLDPASTKCVRSEHISYMNGENKRINLLDGSELSDNLDKGKRQIIFEKGFYDPVKANFMAHGNKTSDTSVHVQATGGQWLHSGSTMDDNRFSLHFNQPTRVLHNRPLSVNTNHYGKVPFNIMGHYNSATNNSTNLALYSAARTGPLHFGTLINSTSPNSYISETASTHAKSIDISQHLTDASIKKLVLRPMIERSMQEQSTTALEGDTRNQNFCYRSHADLQRNLRAGDSETVEDLRHEAYRDTQQTASEFTVRSSRCCSNCSSRIGAEMLANKHGTRGQNEFCNCTILTQRHSRYSKEQNISTCHVCSANEHPCLRVRRMPNCSSCYVKPIFDQKEHKAPFHGKCCCSVLAKHLTSCCLSGDFSSSDPKEYFCGQQGIKHITQASDDVYICHDRKSSDLCECTNKHLGIKNDGQTGFWRDVPAKKVGHSDAISADKPAFVLKSSGVTGDQLLGTASKGSEASQQEVDLMNEQLMSNVCSGSTAPAATEISVEVNKGNSCAASFGDNMNVYDFVADEGSGVEKCGSSDGALCIRKSEETLVNEKVNSDESGYSFPDHSSCDIIDEPRLQTSSNKNSVRNHMHIQCADEENFRMRKVWKEEKRKAQMKMKKLDMFIPESGSSQIISESSHCASHLKWELSSPGESKSLSQPENVMGRSSIKRKRTFLFSSEPHYVNANNHHNILKSEKIQSFNDDQSLRTLAALSEKGELTVCGAKQFTKQEENHFDSEKPSKYMSLNCIVKNNNCETEIVVKKVRPVVCGKSGIISNGVPRCPKKPVKIASLSLILKRSKRCDRNEYGAKSRKPVILKARNVLKENKGDCKGLTSLKVHYKNEDSAKNRLGPTTICMSSTNNQCFKKSDEHIDGFSVIDKDTDGESKREEDPALHHECKISHIKARYKEVRRCSLSKLLGNDKHSTKLSNAPNSGTRCTLTMTETGEQRKASSSTATGDSLVGFASGEGSLNNEDLEGELSQLNTGRSATVHNSQASLLSSNASCGVCGSSNKEDINCLLECNRCLIRVHQACYGVSIVPRGHWFCRPCKTNTHNTVCVLCGYDGGAMTRAVKSQCMVKSLLKAWNLGSFLKSISSSEKVEAAELGFVSEPSKHDNSGSVTSVRSTCFEVPEASVDLTSQNRADEWFLKGLQLYNSITAGVLDPSVPQWVHTVCGLWTPGTRCPNADTMSAFDVSGASASRKSTVCSLCKRPGGCCIQCRVLKCSDHFHPWCAHQKGLLQSELEGDDNENIGFYGRCVLHAAQDGSLVDNHPVDTELQSPKNDSSCARTEGFEGWRSGEGFKSKHLKCPKDNGGCTVSQEQRDAWLHINGQNSCKRAVVKPSCSDFEYDFRESSSNSRYWKKVDGTCTLLNQKEYFRYKQSKAWKRLVVYKSGIHALGLYTSQFIARGAMVVEYVGEIVGQRVADKREIEYQSGRKLQYKSACYFFRIDKDHIIDATRKGGIARFVNHSCQPNCVAKIISVRNDKKVVFFAERDIYPGEEITYDYHFNNEEEGEKIPCYCNSKNCRQYLN